MPAALGQDQLAVIEIGVSAHLFLADNHFLWVTIMGLVQNELPVRCKEQLNSSCFQHVVPPVRVAAPFPESF